MSRERRQSGKSIGEVMKMMAASEKVRRGFSNDGGPAKLLCAATTLKMMKATTTKTPVAGVEVSDEGGGRQ